MSGATTSPLSAVSASFMNASKISKYDAYAKTLDDFRVRTVSGGIVTLVSAVVIFMLLLSEWSEFRTPTINSRIEVDKGRNGRMDIFLNITFPYMPCAIISLDVMDVSGDHQDGIEHDVFKVRLDAAGRRVNTAPKKEAVSSTQRGGKTEKSNQTESGYCGPCYGAKEKGECCNTCDEVRAAYEKKNWSMREIEDIEQCVREGYVQALKDQADEGCMMYGKVSVNRVPGNFHFAPGRSYEQSRFHIHDISGIPTRNFDFSYKIKYLAFGEEIEGIENPLDNTERSLAHDKMFMIQNFIKVVGTKVSFLNGTTTHTNQYAVSEFIRDVSADITGGANAIPGLFFHYDISPMLVVREETRKSLTYFLTSLCAVVGGVFTVAGLFDAGVYRAERIIRQKQRIGKLG